VRPTRPSCAAAWTPGSGSWTCAVGPPSPAATCPARFNAEGSGNLPTYLGWIFPWGTPLTLLGDNPEQVADAQRKLARIGVDRPAAQATGTPERWADGEPLACYDMITAPTSRQPATAIRCTC